MASGLTEIRDVFVNMGQEIASAIATNFDVESIKKKLVEVDVATMQITKSFGLGRDNIVELKGAMTAAVTEVTLLGGKFQDIVDIQKGVGEALGRNLILASESYEKIFAMEQVSGQDIATVLPKMKEVGISTYQTGKEMEKVVNTAREMGVNAQAVSKDVVANMSKLNEYNFDGGVEGLARMAAHATSINMSMESTFNFANKVFNPEGAIETAAALQRLGVTQSQLLDPLKLMDLSMNDPEELQRQMADLGKSFVELNEKGQFQIAPGQKRRMKEIAEAMGMSYGEMAKMAIGAKELDDKMQKIKFPDAIKEEDRQFIANMAEMNEKGEYVVQYKGQEVEVNKLMDKFQGDQKAFQEFMKESEPKTVEELAKAQLDVQQSMDASMEAIKNRSGFAVAGSKLGEDQLEAAKTMYSTIADMSKGFDIKGIRTQYETGMTGVLSSLTNALTGKGSAMDIFTALGDAGKGMSDFFQGGFKSSMESAMSTAQLLQNSNNEIIKVVNAAVGATVDTVKEHEGFNKDGGNTKPPTAQTLMTNDVNNTLNTVTGANQPSSMSTPQTISHDGKIDIRMTLDAPSNVDTAQLQKALEDPNFRMALVKAIQEIQTNYGQSNSGEKK
jgi:hypothetical protein